MGRFGAKVTDLKSLKEKLSLFDKDFALDAGIQIIGIRNKFSQSGEEFSEEEYKNGIGMSYCQSRMKDFRLGARWSNNKDRKTILKLIDIIEIQRDALEFIAEDKYVSSYQSELVDNKKKTQEALEKTDKMLEELSNE
jgi:hypothetical protein